MSIYTVKNNNLKQIKETKFSLEKELQTLTDNNLETVFQLELITTQFSLDGLRIDTLAYDHRLNSFVIIEYKKDKSFSVIDQGYAYLSLMINHKADFILEFNERNGVNIKKSEINWQMSRVLFVASSFTPHQKRAIRMTLPIELWEVKKFDNESVSYNKVSTENKSQEKFNDLAYASFVPALSLTSLHFYLVQISLYLLFFC
jgi:hypothetical protein